MPDAQGNVRVVLGTGAATSIQSIFAYGAYGGRACAIPSVTGLCQVYPSFGYTGQYGDEESGLVYLRARYYDPLTQQFLSRDPLEGASGQPYAYAWGNPINYTDPAGLFGQSQDKVPPVRPVPPPREAGVKTGQPPQLPSGYIGPERQLASGRPWEGRGWKPAVGNGRVYSVAYEARLPRTAYPGVTEQRHFQMANRILLDALKGDPVFAASMESLIPRLRRFLEGPKGGIPQGPPPGWTWHHAIEPGLLQLVPRIQHERGSPLWYVFHQNGVGGYYLWGR